MNQEKTRNKNRLIAASVSQLLHLPLLEFQPHEDGEMREERSVKGCFVSLSLLVYCSNQISKRYILYNSWEFPRNFNHSLVNHKLTIETTNFPSMFQFVAAWVRFRYHFKRKPTSHAYGKFSTKSGRNHYQKILETNSRLKNDVT